MPYRWLAGKYPPFGSITTRGIAESASVDKQVAGKAGTDEESCTMSLENMPNEALWCLERVANTFHLMERSKKETADHGREILSEVKEAFGWTQTYIAERVGVTKYHMSRVFRGVEPVSMKMLTRLYDVIVAEEGRQSRGSDPHGQDSAGAGVPGDSTGQPGVAEVGRSTRLE